MAKALPYKKLWGSLKNQPPSTDGAGLLQVEDPFCRLVCFSGNPINLFIGKRLRHLPATHRIVYDGLTDKLGITLRIVRLWRKTGSGRIKHTDN